MLFKKLKLPQFSNYKYTKAKWPYFIFRIKKNTWPLPHNLAIIGAYFNDNTFNVKDGMTFNLPQKMQIEREI